MKLTFLRHCRSIFNELQYSDKDCDLSVKGEEHARELKGEFDIAICSVMKRARRTLDLSQIRTKSIVYTTLCREWRNDICDFLPDEDEKTERESKEDLALRMEAFKSWVKTNYQGLNVLVVCHADFVFCLTNGEKYLENGEFYEVEV